MPHDDFATEHARGLPAPLPDGEEILWQGRPDAFHLARQSLWLFWVAGYFVFLAVWRFLSLVDLMPLGQAIGASVPFIALGILVCGLLYAVAFIQSRATVYTLTTGRVIMRIGAALTITMQIPFREISNAALDQRKSCGTIAFDVASRSPISYLILWPHMRPWKINPAQPALRCIPDAAHVAELLAEAANTRLAEPQVALRPVPAE